jgi:hypothetical protein
MARREGFEPPTLRFEALCSCGVDTEAELTPAVAPIEHARKPKLRAF